MDKKNFKKFLEDKSWNYDKTTIEQMMEEELEKDPESINMEFVDACMSYLNGSDEITASAKGEVISENKSKIKRISFGRLMVAASITVVVISMVITSLAKANDLNFSNAILAILPGYSTVDCSDTTEADPSVPYDSTELYKVLQDSGIKDIAMPKELFFAPFEELDLHNDQTENAVRFLSEYDDKKFPILVCTYKNEESAENPDILGLVTANKKIDVNGIDVYFFERDGDNSKIVTTAICYEIGSTRYRIDSYYSIEEAEQFVKKMI